MTTTSHPWDESGVGPIRVGFQDLAGYGLRRLCFRGATIASDACKPDGIVEIGILDDLGVI